MNIPCKKGLYLAALLFTPFVMADGSYNLHVFGTIVGESCNVDTQSVEQTVDMGEYSADDFPVPGSTTNPKKFDISLKGCTAAITDTQVWFTGQADRDNPSLLALSDTGKGHLSTMATGLGVELLDSALTPIDINNTESAHYPLAPGENLLTFFLRYKSTLPTVTSGEATAVMYFDLLYQ